MNNKDELAGKWCWAEDGGENYRAAYDTEAEAHGEAQGSLDDEHEAGAVVKYSVARLVHPLDLIGPQGLKRHVEMLIEGLCELAYEECGGDDPAFSIDAAQRVELGEMVRTFLREHASVQRHGVKGAVTHDYVVGSP